MSPRANTRRRQKAVRRRPDVRRLGHRIFAAGIMVSVIAAGTWGLLAINNILSVKSYRIDGPVPFRVAIQNQLRKKPLDFYHTFPPLLRWRLLASIPALADVQVSRRIKGSLSIKAVPRIPIANWTDAKGNTLLVDGNGMTYPGIARLQPILPMLRLPRSELPKAAALLGHLRQLSEDRFKHLSEIDAIDGSWKLYFDHGESWVVPQHGAIRRVNRVYALMEQPRWHKDAWRIDARMDHRWFIRPARSKEVI